MFVLKLLIKSVIVLCIKYCNNILITLGICVRIFRDSMRSLNILHNKDYNKSMRTHVQTLNKRKKEGYLATILYILVEMAMVLVMTARVIITAAMILSLAVEIP